MHATLWIPGIVALGMTLLSAPAPVQAQVVNADYMEIVKRYMPRPSFGSWVNRDHETLRIGERAVPDTLQVGEPGTFAIQPNIETAAVPFEARWHFGDGAVARGLVARHAYETPGQYHVQVAIENHRGRITAHQQVVVVPSDAAEAAPD